MSPQHILFAFGLPLEAATPVRRTLTRTQSEYFTSASDNPRSRRAQKSWNAHLRGRYGRSRRRWSCFILTSPGGVQRAPVGFLSRSGLMIVRITCFGRSVVLTIARQSCTPQKKLMWVLRSKMRCCTRASVCRMGNTSSCSTIFGKTVRQHHSRVTHISNTSSMSKGCEEEGRRQVLSRRTSRTLSPTPPAHGRLLRQHRKRPNRVLSHQLRRRSRCSRDGLRRRPPPFPKLRSKPEICNRRIIQTHPTRISQEHPFENSNGRPTGRAPIPTPPTTLHTVLPRTVAIVPCQQGSRSFDLESICLRPLARHFGKHSARSS